jgi:PAS domain S-box-containing protein
MPHKSARRRRNPASSARHQSRHSTLHGELRRQWEATLESNGRLEVELEYYRDLYANAPTGFALLDRSGTILEINRAAASLLESPHRTVVGKPLIVFVARIDSSRFLQHLMKCRTGLGNVVTELTLGSTDAPKPIRMTSRCGWLPGARAVLHTTLVDISAQLATESTLRDSEKRYREIVETASEGICILDENYRITFVNRRFASMIRDPSDRLIGRAVTELLSDDDAIGATDIPHAMALARVSERRIRRADRTHFWASVSFTTMRNSMSDLAGFLLMFTDVSERRELETMREQLVLRLVNAQEEERRRVARELHDQLGQHLTGLDLGLSRLRSLSVDNPDATELIRKLREIASEMSRDAHHLALELRPAALDDLGLAEAVSNYADDIARRAALDVDVHCDLKARLDPAIETTIYRVIQEALNNVVKHARAKRVSVILARQDGALQAIIEDDGIGFKAEKVLSDANGRLGVVGMRERITLVGGELKIESRPGRGTTLFVRLPIKAGDRTTPTDTAGRGRNLIP